MKIIYILLLLLLFTNCRKIEKISKPSNLEGQSKNKNYQTNALTTKGVLPTYILEKGLICLTEENEQSKIVIEIFNENGSIWKKIDFASPLNNENEFAPFAYHPDYFPKLALDCVQCF